MNNFPSLSTCIYHVLLIHFIPQVFIDTDLYGDKELKIATINKLKQKLRDAINKDNTVAPYMLELAINDALGYNAETTVIFFFFY